MNYVQPHLNLTGEQLRDQGITQTLEAEAHQEWVQDAYHWLARLPYGQEVTSVDLITAVGMPPGSPNAIGAVFRTAAMQELLTPTDRYVTNTRAVAHARPVRVWRST